MSSALPLAGLRVLDYGQYVAAPFATMLLADLGADVVKVEPPRGDEWRRYDPFQPGESRYFYALNRGKRSIGLDISTDDGRELLYKLVETADVFVTNYLPQVRAKLGIEVDDIRARNPDIVYVRGSGHGARGPEAERGGFDGASFWARAGLAMTFKDPAAEWPVDQRPAFGDVLGGLTIAGGITSPASISAVTTAAHRSRRRWRT